MEQQRDYYREVAESLLASNSSFSRQLLGNSNVSLLGQNARTRPRISDVRRFFCLFCTFDLLFTALLWLISVMLTGEAIADMWQKEVIGYKIATSMLDVVGAAAIRFLLLLLAYAAFKFDHWTVVALTTSGTCTFLIAKVFIFEWLGTAQPVFQVLLVLVSFSLCWAEAWLLDCKVLPQEQLFSGSGSGPLLFPVGPRLGPSDLTSVGDFYSPTESPDGSPRFDRRLPNVDDELVRSGLACEKEALQLLESADWRREKTGPCVGDLVESLRHPKYGKMFRLTGIVDCPVEFLFKEMTEGLERMSEWNPTILECKIVKQVDPSTSLTYQVTTGGPQNVVKPRDFVNVRRVSRVGGRLLSSAVSVEYPTLPPLDTYIRGHNHVGCWSIEAKQDEGREKVLFQWLMACDLKGWLPQYVLDTAFSTAQLDFLRHLRDFAAQCRVDGSF